MNAPDELECLPVVGFTSLFADKYLKVALLGSYLLIVD